MKVVTTGASPLDRGATLYRVQAADGRGPWRPGLSHHWSDESRTTLQSGILDAFGTDWLKNIPHGWHAGCACRSLDGLMEWFTPLEQERLASMGYAPVAVLADIVLAENADQVAFARRDPLAVSVVPLAWPSATPIERAKE